MTIWEIAKGNGTILMPTPRKLSSRIVSSSLVLVLHYYFCQCVQGSGYHSLITHFIASLKSSISVSNGNKQVITFSRRLLLVK